MNKPRILWENFKTAFITSLGSIERAALLEMWQSLQTKTAFYENVLMPEIGRILGYEMHVERLRCDYTFLDKNGIPLIAVEAENAHQTSWREIGNLCSLAAPLKILILSCDWKETEKARLLPEWIKIIRAHHEVVSVDCLYGILVGEWDKPDDALLHYSFSLLDTTGTLVEDSYEPVK